MFEWFVETLFPESSIIVLSTLSTTGLIPVFHLKRCINPKKSHISFSTCLHSWSILVSIISSTVVIALENWIVLYLFLCCFDSCVHPFVKPSRRIRFQSIFITRIIDRRLRTTEFLKIVPSFSKYYCNCFIMRPISQKKDYSLGR